MPKSRAQSPFSTPLPSCHSFPQNLERIISVLPRPWLDWFEIHAFPRWIPEDRFLEDLAFWHGRKVAFVRQSAALVTYRAGSFSNWMDRALTTKGHPGPLSLLAELAADFYVVRQAPDPETHAWRGKHAGDPNPEESFRRMEAYRESEENLPGVVSCEDIRWEDYDLVVCLDIPVPTRIARRTQRTLWAYISIEGGGPLVDLSLQRPVDGYHLYLNHQFRRYRVRPTNRRHVVEFPFSFQSRKAWSDLFHHLNLNGAQRKGIVIDRGSGSEIPKPRDPDVQVMGEAGGHMDLASLAALYASKKYALRLDPRRRWGNWLVEVVQAGCLFLGRSDTLDHLSPMIPSLNMADYHGASRKVAELESNPDLYATCRSLQGAITEHVAFRRPLADLTSKARDFFA